MENLNRGITIFATGHPYYGRMAYNLALTIKATGTELPVAVIHDATSLRHLDEQQMDVFDVKVMAKAGDTINILRLNLPKYTPFKETLALDADIVWIGKDPELLFELLQDRDFTCINEGYIDMDNNTVHTTGIYTSWAEPEKIKEAYEVTGKLYQLRGEFILIRKSKQVSFLYSYARKVQKDGAKIPIHRWADGDITDEFALNLAANKTGIEPHESIWLPTYWPQRERFLLPPLHILNKQYWALSFGGNLITSAMKNMHDDIVKAASHRLGLHFVFTIQPKRNFLTDRKFN